LVAALRRTDVVAADASATAAAEQDPETLRALLDAAKRAYDKIAERAEGVTVETNRLNP
jgi:ABC-type nitrate/sulfonate/bicarbonate transport system substrate-binding protein